MKLPAILFLEPNRVWRTYPGGMILDQMAGIDNPKDSHFPEDWIGSTTRAVNKGREHLIEEGLSKVKIDDETMTLKSLCEKAPLAILGKQHFEKYGANTRFLLKFLDSAIRLHIQCHPTIPFAQKYLHSNSGKTEAYIILGFRDEVSEPYIFMGFQNPPDIKDFKRMIEEQDEKAILACFEKIPIKPGDVFIVPGGMPHAIGEGVFMIEVMEPTDFAVRIEFERGGYVLPEESRFMNRGIDFALSMFTYNPTSITSVKNNYFCEPRILKKQNQSLEYILIDAEKTPCFSVNRIEVKDRYVKESETFYIGIITKGSGTIRINQQSWPVKEGMKFFIPYQTGSVQFESEDSMEIITSFPPA
ncbi:MAG: class I mannose-6-phosphate isomerase [Bacteroidales bacterium]|nr:class I mannose-6-phosphate isomerase [Bacteroidales bacterium]MCF8390432.1 class I mannose-6-phosphate isomerase [Bacteroidales bacterium]